MARTHIALLLALTSLACGTPNDPGTPVAAGALCTQIVEIVCDADRTCCHGVQSTCAAEQTMRCNETIGALALDPRVAYVPERGGALLADLEVRAAACWDSPFEPSELTALFAGTGAIGQSCTAGATLTASELRLGALSCAAGSACRIHLAVDGTPRGVCEARASAGTTACSHAFDCAGNDWCELPTDWHAGDWGTCQSPRTDGWQCSADLECASGYCSASGCAPRPAVQRCLSIGYRDVITSDAPVAYFRLGETSGHAASDAMSGGAAGTYVDPIAHAAAGAITGDTDGALALTGMGGHVSVAALTGTSTSALTVELWVEGPTMGGGPLLELAAHDVVIGLTLASGVVTASFLGSHDTTPTTLATPAHAIGTGFHHLALTIDETGAHLFVDGASVAMLAGEREIPAAPSLAIGFHDAAMAAMQTSLTGTLDEVAIYARALPSATLARHAAAGAGPLDNELPLFAWAR